ncbi:MAG: hypothetical protein U0L42_09970 [Methanobrevibacter sp.]|uniref:hypothetical protein n=1 Tax=Methanobrevibacter sp. TaxID=66852 RepID=UPI0025FAAE73|nr:hypothetical protein [Methanobrevibacter sp.]MEE0935989.1 hypothetical protein [Methanobrevibacter sp.]
MKLKLAIILGVLIWVLTYAFSQILNPLFNDNLPQINIVVPIIVIILTGFFGIIYIRNINENEVIEGLIAGVIFILVDVICDVIFLVIPNQKNMIFGDYQLHVISMIILTLLITTFLGYLAQMNIDLK